MPTAEATGQPDPIQLSGGKHQDSVMPLRWCLSGAARKTLADYEVKQPYQLIVIENNGVEMHREVVPTLRLMLYLQFRRPGVNIVHSTTAWGENDYRPQKNLLKRRSDGSYVVEVLRPRRIRLEEQLVPQRTKLESQLGALDVEVRKDQERVNQAQQRQTASGKSQDLARIQQKAEVLVRELEAHGDTIASVTDDYSIVAELGEELESLRDQLQEAELPPEPVEVHVEEVNPQLISRQAALQAELDQLKAEIVEAEEASPDEYMLRESFEGTQRLPSEGQLEVPVDRELYAKDPPRIRAWLAGLYRWDSAPRDQCVQRKRAWVYTAPTLPFFALWGLVLLTVNAIGTAVLLVAGVRNVNYTPFRHPYIEKLPELWRDAEPSFWFKSKHMFGDGSGHFYRNRPLAVRLISPPVVVPLAAVLVEANIILSVVATWLVVAVALLGPLAVVAAILVVGGVLVLLISAVEAIVDYLEAAFGDDSTASDAATRERRKWEAKEAKAKAKREAEERARQRERMLLEVRLKEMACSAAGSAEASLEALPKNRRTVVLRFEDLKSRVCKPFAA